LSPFVVNVVESEVEYGQSLSEKENIQITETKERRYSLYYFSENQQDIGPPSLRFYFVRDRVWSVSVRERKDAND
jgi:hypothetical protein